MWTTKTFLTKTKRGNVLKIVREHYLRDDLLCGSAACNVCPQKDDDFVLEAKPESVCGLFDYSHYLVLDTNVVLHQIDVLEEDALKNVIILQTVLEEVKHQNTAIFQRLLEIIGNKKRKFYSFVNEHHKDTYVERNPGEKQNDRNDRAIRKAAAWYSSHLSINSVAGQFPQIVLLTDDENNRKIAQEEGTMCCSVKDYIENVNGFPGLADKLSKNVIPETCSKDALYPAHLTPTQIHAGIKNGKLHQGTFHASRDNFMEGTASVSGHEKPVLLQGHIGINRAIDGDIVAVEILPKEEWSKPSDIVLEDKADDPGDFLEDSTLVKPKVDTEDDDITPTGKVVGIIKRKWRQYCGILLPSKFPGATRHLFTPAEKRIPRVRIETRQSDILFSQRILVALDSWPRNSRYPLGHFVRSLGPIGDKDAENEVILLEHDVPHARFSEAVLACLPPDDWTIPDEEIKKRVDLRSTCVCSVDPPGCTDIDDALHARLLPARTKDGLKKYDVGVHIADVTYFVRPNTALDKEAASRSTTVYLVGKRIDMVPDLLSSNLCSLRGGEERLAFSCVWEIDENANVLSTKFHKSVIKSRAAMTYEEAQLAIDERARADDVATSLRALNALAKKLKQKRLDNGALLLASPEIRFQVDSETHDPVEVQAKQIMDTNSMVEEFMLLANVSVAQRLAAEFPQCALLRRHPAPPPANFHTFLKAARQQVTEVEEFMLLANVSVAQRLAAEFPQCALLRRHPAPPPANFHTFLKAARQQVTEVEEFMLLANVSVAQRLAAEFPQCALLRRHPAPPPANFHTFLKAARQQVTEVEEFMLLANVSVAQRLAAEFPQCALLRRHPAPPPANFHTFLKAARQQVTEVEEFMLLANVSVAQRLAAEFPQCALLRRHPAPPPANFHTFLKAARQQVTEVEEFMLLANVSVAQRLAAEFPQCALLRRHPAPPPANFHTFLKAARQQVTEVEEFMLLANVSVAQRLAAEFPQCALLRRHPAPPPANFHTFLKAARQQVTEVEEFMLLANVSVAQRLAAEFPQCALLRRHPAPPPANFHTFLKAARQQVTEVEEFMLLANVSVAQRLAAEFPQCALLRRHPAPPPANFHTFLKAARQQVTEVEEFMLLANVSVAQRLAAEFPQCALLRRHPAPPPANFHTFLKAARQQVTEVEEFMLLANVSVAQRLAAEFPQCALLRRHPAPPPANFHTFLKAARQQVTEVEEFMLLANVSVAQRLAAEFPQCALLRRHPAPPPANFHTFLKAARQQGFELDVSTNKAFSRSLDEAVIPGRPYFNTLLRIMATRCMQQAVYFSSGTRTQDEFYHYGLACPIYTHFTSPIRRYADVIVHRLLAACIGADVTHASLLDTKHADALCDNLNYRHRQAQYAGRASVALNTHILFKNREEIDAAVVLAVKRNALQVLIPKYGLEGPLYLPADKFVYNEEEHVQICGGTVLKTFDELTVRLTLDSSNLQHRKLVFQLVTPYIAGVSYVKDEPDSTREAMDVEVVDITDSTRTEKKRNRAEGGTKSKKKKSKK